MALCDPLEIVAMRYFSGKFPLHVIAWLPLGLLSELDPTLSFLWIVKAVRIQRLVEFFSERELLPIVNFYIESRQKAALNDKASREDF